MNLNSKKGCLNNDNAFGAEAVNIHDVESNSNKSCCKGERKKVWWFHNLNFDVQGLPDSLVIVNFLKAKLPEVRNLSLQSIDSAH
jgi:hypothetical protein